ncbi:MAG: ABC transporter ATP-binding protein [Cyanobacteria bacterium P01_H01_bin.15]
MLQITQLSKWFGEQQVVQNLSFDIFPGEVFGLLGPNGAGKTTTINLICGLLQSDQGQLKLAGDPINERSKSLIGIAPQQNLLYGSLTCQENLDFFARIYGLSPQQRKQQVRQALAAVNLSERRHTLASQLSGGMQRRLNVAIALVHEPKLVILDEPTTGLDIDARYEIWALIHSLQKKGTAVLLTTHLLDEAERLCQRIGILQLGQLVAQGSLDELRTAIPAAAIALLETTDEPKILAKAACLGWTCRRYREKLALWLPQLFSLSQVVALLGDLPVSALSISPVTLEYLYLEITQSLQTIPPR